MSQTSLSKRILAGLGALLFLVTGSALTIMVIWDTVRGNDQNTQSTSLNDSDSTRLAGTKLSDFEPVNSVSSLQVIDTKVGEGQEVKAGQTVSVDYTGAVAATGVIFQSSLDTGQPVEFSLTGVIEGWQEGIPGMKVGGIRRLIIPAAKAYADSPPEGSGIPVNADLVFDITLHAVE